MANRLIKEKWGFPTGSAPSNGSYMWKAAREKWGFKGWAAADAALEHDVRGGGAECEPGEVRGAEALDARARRALEVPRPAVVDEALPAAQYGVLVGCRERLQVREALQPAAEVGDHRRHLRLLQHHLGDQHAVRVAGGAPRQIAVLGAEPGQQGVAEGVQATVARGRGGVGRGGVGRGGSAAGRDRPGRPAPRAPPPCIPTATAALAVALPDHAALRLLHLLE